MSTKSLCCENMSQICISQIEEHASKLDKSTVSDSGFPKFVRPLITLNKTANEPTIDLDPIFYGLYEKNDTKRDQLLRNYIITPKRVARLLTETIVGRPLSSYFGVEVSGPFIHIGHLIPTLALGYLKQNFNGNIGFNILLADEHTKKSKEITESELQYNTLSLREQLSRLFPFAEIVVGSEFQFSRGYIEAIRAMKKHISVPQASKGLPALTRKPLLDSSSEDFRKLLEDKGLKGLTDEDKLRQLKSQIKSFLPWDEVKLSMLDYTADEATDPAFAGGCRNGSNTYIPGPCDLVFGGGDQRGAYMITEEKIGYIMNRKPAIVLAPLLTSLSGLGQKMSKSDRQNGGGDKGIIWVGDSSDVVRMKLNRAYCPDTSQNNPVSDLYRFMIFPFYRTVLMKESHGSSVGEYTPEEFYNALNHGRLDSDCMKEGAAKYLSAVLSSLGH
ncbi:MAG: hypothetical protein V1944_02665 [Candidatus Aenigmatarchaeota archaeon]